MPAYASSSAYASFPATAASDLDLSALTDRFEEIRDSLSGLFAGMEEEDIDKALEFLGDKAADGSLSSEEGIEEAVKEGQETFGIELDEKQVSQISELVKAFEDLGFSAENIIGQTKSLYDKYGADFLDHTEELVESVVRSSWFSVLTNAIGRFFQSLWEWLKGAVNIFG